MPSPLPPDTATLKAYARAAALRERLDPLIFERQIQKESSWRVDAVSASGAIGIAQIIPKWHPGVNAHAPFASLDYAAALMRRHLDTFDGRIDLALAAYNAGPNAVRKYGGVPPFPEVTRYVDVILNTKGGAKMPVVLIDAGHQRR